MSAYANARDQGFSRNRILSALPPGERQQVFEVVKNVTLPIKTVLFEPGAPIDAIHFPIDGVISLVTPLQRRRDRRGRNHRQRGDRRGAAGSVRRTGGSSDLTGRRTLPAHGRHGISRVGGAEHRLPRARRELHAGALRPDLAGGGVQPPPLERGAPQPLAPHEPRSSWIRRVHDHPGVPRADARRAAVDGVGVRRHPPARRAHPIRRADT